MYNDIKNMNLNIDMAKPVTEAEIVKFEAELSVKFGEEYQGFLKEFGCMSVEYLEFYGICGKNTSIPSAIHATKFMRKEVGNFSKNLIVVHEDGSGSFYCIDSDDNVYLCNFNNCEKTGKTFKAFLTQKLQGL